MCENHTWGMSLEQHSATSPLNVIVCIAVPLDRCISGAQALFNIFGLIANCSAKLQVVDHCCIPCLHAGLIAAKALALYTNVM